MRARPIASRVGASNWRTDMSSHVTNPNSSFGSASGISVWIVSTSMSALSPPVLPRATGCGCSQRVRAGRARRGTTRDVCTAAPALTFLTGLAWFDSHALPPYSTEVRFDKLSAVIVETDGRCTETSEELDEIKQRAVDALTGREWTRRGTRKKVSTWWVSASRVARTVSAFRRSCFSLQRHHKSVGRAAMVSACLAACRRTHDACTTRTADVCAGGSPRSHCRENHFGRLRRAR